MIQGLLQTISDGIDTNRRHYFFGNNENTIELMIENLKDVSKYLNHRTYLSRTDECRRTHFKI